MHRALREEPETSTTITAISAQMAAGIAAILMAEMQMAERLRPSAEAWAHGIVGAVQTAGDWWLRLRQMSGEQLADHLTELLWTGVQQLRADGPAARSLAETGPPSYGAAHAPEQGAIPR